MLRRPIREFIEEIRQERRLRGQPVICEGVRVDKIIFGAGLRIRREQRAERIANKEKEIKTRVRKALLFEGRERN